MKNSPQDAQTNKKLESIMRLFKSEEIVTTEDVNVVVQAIGNVLANFSKNNQILNEKTEATVEKLLKTIIARQQELEKNFNEKQTKAQKEQAKNLTDALKEVKKLVDFMIANKPEDGADADEEKIIQEVLAQIKLPEYKQEILEGGDIVDKINSLTITEENQIDASHIKNLPETVRAVGGRGIVEAPRDNKIYGRKNRAWIEVTSGGGSISLTTTGNSGASTLVGSTLNVPNYTLAGLLPSLTAGSVLVSDGTTITQDNSNFFWDNTNKYLGLKTNTPTRSLTLGSTSTGIALYNTVDQTTNYERVTTSWSSNVFKITSEKGGTGTVRQLVLQTSTRSQIAINDTANATNGFVHLSSSTSTANATGLSASFGSSASSGVSNIVGIFGTLTQSGTAGYTALLVNPTETSTGSGTKLLADFQVGGSSKFKVDNTGAITSAVATINLSAASITRSGAHALTLTTSGTTNATYPSGTITLVDLSATQTLTNKRITPRVTAISSNTATPAINTDNYDYVEITAQTVNITSMTTSLSGTPNVGQQLWIAMTAGSGTPTVSWGTGFEDPGSLLPSTLSTTRVDVGFKWNTATSKWKCVGKV